MTPERWEQVKTLLATAIDMPPEQRTPAYLDGLCRHDPALVAELQALLAAHQRPEAANLDTPIVRIPVAPPEPLLMNRARLASYEILRPLGAGGMGEVYCARDVRLGREVALKILPDSFAHDPGRVARFRREAQVLAALNHPHIAAIHGLEQANGTLFLVLELADGETLDKRIARGPIPVAGTLAIARQLADALEAAHDQGIVHRDLKPANIALTRAGDVKVLDFGLAKPTDAWHEGLVDAANGPTPSRAAMTSEGLIVGTAAYMAPEQACGRAVDKRADIWAFGVVIYEMLAGQRAFAGDSNAEILAKVLEREPDWMALPDTVPDRLRRLLARCLTKDPKARLRDIGEARILIDEILNGPRDDALNPPGSPAVHRGPFGLLLWLATAGALAVGLALMFMWWMAGRHQPLPGADMRLSVELGTETSLAKLNSGAAAVLSPDGTVMAFVGQKPGRVSQLYIRHLAQTQAAAIAGTDGAESPFFSPDGQWIAFFADDRLKKIPVSGGPAITLAEAPTPRGGVWSDDGSIVFAGIGPIGLQRVSSIGGPVARLTTMAPGETNHRWPEVLPGGKAVLFASTHTSSFHDANLVIQPLPSGRRRDIVQHGSYPRYVHSGHVLYVHDGRLLAVPFDLTRLEVTGQPVTVIEGVASDASGAAQVAASASGTLVYVPAPSSSSGVPIHWMDHAGAVTALRVTPTNWTQIAVAPDGRRLALTIADGAHSDIWVYEWARDTLTRLTADPGVAMKPVWTPDGRRVVFGSERGDNSTLNLYWQRADGIGEVQRLADSPYTQVPGSWHPSGRLLAFSQLNPQTSWDLMILPVGGDEASGWKPGKPTVFSSGAFLEVHPAFSPDGRWIAYASNESGRPEVYVRPFPGPGGKWQISSAGGNYPIWSRAKRELFYGTPDGQIMVASYAVDGDTFTAEKPRVWSDMLYVSRGGIWPFDLHPDGERFALTAAMSAPNHDHVTAIFNVFDDLRRIAPATKR